MDNVYNWIGAFLIVCIGVVEIKAVPVRVSSLENAASLEEKLELDTNQDSQLVRKKRQSEVYQDGEIEEVILFPDDKLHQDVHTTEQPGQSQGNTDGEGTGHGAEGTGDHPRHKRKVNSNKALLWPGGLVHYVLTDSLSSHKKQLVRNAMHHIEQETCIRFVDMEESTTDRFLVAVVRIGSIYGAICSSYIGRVAMEGEAQELNLGNACFRKIGIVIHELAHVLGLWHEHQRPRRDDHIKVMYENMRRGKESNFDKASEAQVVDFFPYDFSSVTHYALRDNGRTIVDGDVRKKLDVLRPYDQRYRRSMGQRLHLSFIDAHAINQMYCTEHCRSNPPVVCFNGGYEDPNNCGTCKCPAGITTPNCRTDIRQPDRRYYDSFLNKGVDCGGIIDLEHGSSRTVMSPRRRYGREYRTDTTCTWLVNAPPGKRVRLQFYGDFGLYMDTSTGSEVCLHWVQVQTDKSKYYIPGPRLCGSVTPTEAVVSTSDQMLVMFQSNFTVPDETVFRQKGFMAQLSIASDNITIQHGTNTTITSTTTSTTTSASTSTTMPSTATSISTTTEAANPTTTTSITPRPFQGSGTNSGFNRQSGLPQGPPSVCDAWCQLLRQVYNRGNPSPPFILPAGVSSIQYNNRNPPVLPVGGVTSQQHRLQGGGFNSNSHQRASSQQSGSRAGHVTVTWSAWGACADEACPCGGYTTRRRTRLCNSLPCLGSMEGFQEEVCDSICRLHMVAGVIYNNGSCGECKEGWIIDNQRPGRCKRNF